MKPEHKEKRKVGVIAFIVLFAIFMVPILLIGGSAKAMVAIFTVPILLVITLGGIYVVGELGNQIDKKYEDDETEK